MNMQEKAILFRAPLTMVFGGVAVCSVQKPHMTDMQERNSRVQGPPGPFQWHQNERNVTPKRRPSPKKKHNENMKKESTRSTKNSSAKLNSAGKIRKERIPFP